MDMSSISDRLSILDVFGRTRRQLNLLATAALRPLGIGPKQARILREVRARGSTSLAELSKATHTDPASTGRIVDSLILKKWIRRNDDPADRRKWLISLTEDGAKGAKSLEGIIRELARDLCEPLSAEDRASMNRILNLVSNHLERTLVARSEESAS